MKSVAIVVAALLLSKPALAEVKVTGAQIVEYGIYTAEIDAAKRDNEGVLQSKLGNISHTATTTTVPARHGVRFGFRYKIIGTPAGATVPIKILTVFPPGGLKPCECSAADLQFRKQRHAENWRGWVQRLRFR
jgi:Domain of unknown function (DUF3859)